MPAQPDPRWAYEPCDPEGQLADNGVPYPHAARGVRPAARGRQARVTGYGSSESGALREAKRKALEYDAREVLPSNEVNTTASRGRA